MGASRSAKAGRNSSRLADTMQVTPMLSLDLEAVVAIENAVHTHPWSKAGFVDSLLNDHLAEVARDASARCLGYFVLMLVVDEAHLLNISVRADAQGQGVGRALLTRACELARSKSMESVLLEVRQSNLRAINTYTRHGFVEIGRRKNYYTVTPTAREDAVVMRFTL
ncbi:ribosomal protein S18-alanine N-acetyltransferase [Herbaspirillum sp. RTI4]|uniref:ribosomal protein S18-alanine N-acetyltransferase n=1 Tax=Herbaspirillum sp. RTI4 TaxID=3048640 RepID=UPI002AB4B9AF|nr:ribosomal protein S18-alanine N-acetyltransferase [Herbaspirillum sp. RTI4]MDY7578650.1 ribosomal protein S18-alanine N-acetyltransferase [Herbaspirillum sp. RTI4]MEA9980652.1 ribosomal protein S18-alanine N-acetyltransferase [Herbaspirillum sp. RTI4]